MFIIVQLYGPLRPRTSRDAPLTQSLSFIADLIVRGIIPKRIGRLLSIVRRVIALRFGVVLLLLLLLLLRREFLCGSRSGKVAALGRQPYSEEKRCWRIRIADFK